METVQFNEPVAYGGTTSAVMWSAVIAGAFTSAATSLILVLLGSGLGFASVSPWSRSGITVAAFTMSAALWLILMQIIASGLGGYLTGRLRSRRMAMHTDEVYFRDTAHGFLAWALATLLSAALLASATASVIGGGFKAAAVVSAGAAAGAGYGAAKNSGTANDPTAYFVDGLYRSDRAETSETDRRAEAARILISELKDGNISDADKAYLARSISAHTGLSPADASKRVDEAVADIASAKEKAKEASEAARKIAMHVALYTFLSLLIGAFVASYCAAVGGKHRDQML